MTQRLRTSLTTVAFVLLVAAGVLTWVRPDLVMSGLGLDAYGTRGATTVRAVYGSGLLYLAVLVGWALLRPSAARTPVRAVAGWVLVVGLSRFAMDAALGTWSAAGVAVATAETLVGLVLVFLLPMATGAAPSPSGRGSRSASTATDEEDPDANPLNAYRS